jgi:hypothetical protein
MNAVLLSGFEQGHITGSEGHPWLQKFEGMFEHIVKAYEFIRDNDMMIVLPGVVENKAVQKNAWHVFPIYVNRNNPQYIDFLSYQLGVDIRAVQQVLRQNMKEIFAVLDAMTEDSPIINVTFYRMRPGTTLKLHADSGSFQYRAHMGVQVPKGNCGLKVKDSVVRWKEGRFFVFDSTQPHMAWNLTDEERIVFSIDFLREPVAANRDVHLQEVLRRMDSTPLGFEGGGYLEIDAETMNKFNRIVDVVEF